MIRLSYEANVDARLLHDELKSLDFDVSGVTTFASNPPVTWVDLRDELTESAKAIVDDAVVRNSAGFVAPTPTPKSPEEHVEPVEPAEAEKRSLVP